MPRTRFDEPKHKKLAVLLNGYVNMGGGTPKAAAAKLNKDYKTLCRKLRDPGKFTVEDLLHFARTFHVSIEELRDAIEK